MDDQRQRTWRRLWAAVVLVISVASIWVVPSLASPDPGGELLLPDLDQATPSRLFTYEATSNGTKEFGLAFDSAVDNVGQGPLLMHGNRQSIDTPEMVATQQVRTATGATIDHPDAGTMRYVESADHNHWHLDGFDRYELRRPGDQDAARPDRKTGFCLGDRYETDRTTDLPNEPQAPQITGYCEPSNRGALTVDQGMSVGWGDNYVGRLEGQSIDVTGLAAGNYLLIHRVNADGQIEEVGTANNAASVLLHLTWPQGPDAKPTVTVLARCADSDTCAAPPAPAGVPAPAAGAVRRTAGAAFVGRRRPAGPAPDDRGERPLLRPPVADPPLRPPARDAAPVVRAPDRAVVQLQRAVRPRRLPLARPGLGGQRPRGPPGHLPPAHRRGRNTDAVPAQEARVPAARPGRSVTLPRLTAALFAATALAVLSCAPPASATLLGAPAVVASGLQTPWDVVPLPDGRTLVSELPGRVRVIEPGGTLRAAPAYQGDANTKKFLGMVKSTRITPPIASSTCTSATGLPRIRTPTGWSGCSTTEPTWSSTRTIYDAGHQERRQPRRRADRLRPGRDALRDHRRRPRPVAAPGQDVG